MKILYLMSNFPYPPHAGGSLRILGLLQGVAQAGHELHLLSLGIAPNETTPVHEICQTLQVIPPLPRSKGQRLQTLLLSNQADMEQRSWNPHFLAALENLLAQETFDIIQFESLEMGVYLPHVRRLQPNAKLIYDAFNAEADLQRMVYETDRANWRLLPMAIYSRLQWKRLTTFEQTLCQTADAVIAVSEEDKVSLQTLAGKTPLWVVPNGITVKDYLRQRTSLDLKLKQPSLVFTGTMDYRPNVDAAVWFAKEIFPLLEDVHLYLVGNRPAPRVQALASNPNITITGLVLDILPYLHQASVFIVPLRVGSGTRLKLLQAMAAGCAIVSTSVGAMGLDVRTGREMLIADSEVEFAVAIRQVLDNKLAWLQLSENGQVFVRQKFDWKVIVPRLLEVYNELTGQ